MNVLVAVLKYPADDDGGQRFHKMFRRLIEKEDLNKVHVITSRNKKQQAREVRGGINVYRAAGKPAFLKLIATPFYALKVIRKYFSLYRDANVVFTSGSGWLPSLAGWLAWITRKPLMKEIVLLHGDDPLTLARKKFWTRPFFTMPFRFASVVVTISPPLEKACLEFGVPLEKVWCRLNPVDFPVTVTEEDCLACGGTAIGQTAEPPMILWAGSLKKCKNVDFLLRAARHLKPPVKLVFAGLREDKKYCDELVDMALKLPEGIDAEFTGELRDKEELVSLYRKARVFWFAPHSEGLGNEAAEALVCGTPVVTLSVHGIMQSMIIPGEDGEIVPETNPRAFAAAVNRWAEKKYHRCEIARRAADRFDAGRTDDAYVNWFYKITNERRKRSPAREPSVPQTGGVLVG